MALTGFQPFLLVQVSLNTIFFFFNIERLLAKGKQKYALKNPTCGQTLKCYNDVLNVIANMDLKYSLYICINCISPLIWVAVCSEQVKLFKNPDWHTLILFPEIDRHPQNVCL